MKIDGEQLKSLGRVMSLVLKNYRGCCIIVVLCILFTALTTLTATLFMRTLIDDYIGPLVAAATPDFAPLAQALMRLAAILLVGVCCSYARSRIMVNVSQGTLKRLRIDLFTNMESLPIKYFDTHAHGDIMSVYTNDVDTMRQVISESTPQLINSVITLVSTFVSMIVLSVPLTLVSVAMVAVMLLVSTRLSGISGSYFTRQQHDLGEVNGYIEEMMQGQKVVKVFCHEDKSLEQFRELNEQLRDSANNAHRIANIMMPINNNLGHISYVLCAVVGAVLALNGNFGLTIGTLVSFLTLNKSFSQPIAQISQQLGSIVMASAGADRAFSLLDAQPEVDNGYVELVNAKENPDGTLTETPEKTGVWAWKHFHKADGTTTYVRLEGDVTFDGVDFGYDDNKMVLHDIRMYATPGQKIAFVGSTGAGKTTITNLINRFYDIQDGKIRYDGININKIKKPDLRRSLGIVLQDTHLFTGTVMDNIRYGRLDATDEECIQAARLANADGFIRRLPDGYETMLTGDGSNLSQGQRQLLAIARAAVADPPVLILDEATSSIDTRTERLVQEGMDALMKGRTSFVIAHRLSTVRNADCIMVLEQGRIIERGTHDQLIEQKGKYYQLYTGNAITA
ncbi:MAG: ABC transporter ATP-binding protein/permease [Clostridiales bacterium]|nr:ABC transporter ATP-binding protein/permease [Clostridiales bacterium]MCD7754107.1 ABC transporter ATP-binding protein/permease [Clostridiales bacterium]